MRPIPLAAGTSLGPYEIIGPLGGGGIGEVYRAHDSRLNRDVALRTLPAAFFEDANRLARLHREAQALAALNHPNIGTVYGLEEDGSARALVMELVEGPTLAERIRPTSGRPGPIALDEAKDIARQIADALAAAHEKGIVHRDLKPANVKITGPASGNPGKVKVLDFGLAKIFGGDGDGGSSGNSPTLLLECARLGIILGTPAYMSPEQARGRPVAKTTDIWSFGVVLYEMLTARMAFAGETISDTMAAVLRGEVDWTRLPPGTPPHLRRLLERCLERDPRKRLSDIGDVRLQLETPKEPIAPAPPPPPPPPAPVPTPAPALPPQPAPLPVAARTGRRWLPWLAAVAMGAAGVGAGWLLWNTPTGGQGTPLGLDGGPVMRWSYTQKNDFAAPALSRDGSRLALAELEGTPPTPRLVMRMLDQGQSKPIPGGEGGGYPVFSPDGQWIAFFRSGALQKIPATGGAAVTLVEKAGPPSDWGENGEILFSSAGGFGLLKVAAAGGQAEVLTAIDAKKGETGHWDPHFLPGGQAIVFTIDTGGSRQVAALDLKSGTQRILVNDASFARYVPAGHLVYLRGATLLAAPFNPRRMELTGPAVAAIDGVSSGLAAMDEYSVSDSGLLVYMSGGAATGTILAWADRKGVVEPLTLVDSWGNGKLSPDGRLIASQIYAGRRPEGDIWIYDVERRAKVRLTSGGANENPTWTPDGRRVTFGAAIAGKHGIYSAPSDGSGKADLLLETEDRARPTSWSPDGKALVYSMPGKDEPSHLWMLPVAARAGAPSGSGKPHRLHDTAFFEDEGEVSPDGNWLAYTSTESGSKEVYVQPFPGPGAKVRISTEGGQSPRWLKNGRELFYWGNGRAKLMSVDVQTAPPFRAGIPNLVLARAGGNTWDVTPDGKRFLVEQSPPTEKGARELEVVVNWFAELRRLAPAGK